MLFLSLSLRHCHFDKWIGSGSVGKLSKSAIESTQANAFSKTAIDDFVPQQKGVNLKRISHCMPSTVLQTAMQTVVKNSHDKKNLDIEMIFISSSVITIRRCFESCTKKLKFFATNVGTSSLKKRIKKKKYLDHMAIFEYTFWYAPLNFMFATSLPLLIASHGKKAENDEMFLYFPVANSAYGRRTDHVGKKCGQFRSFCFVIIRTGLYTSVENQFNYFVRWRYCVQSDQYR